MSKEKSGVSLTVQDLFNEGQKSLGLDLHFRQSSNFISGDKRSRVRGRGMDFFESRPYVLQDEIKNIDWKVSARLNSLFTKIYTEEKDRPVFIMVDLRSSMFFGSINCFKSVLAGCIAARLAMAAINGGDHVGGLVFNGHDYWQCAIKSGRKNLARLFGLIALQTDKAPLPKRDFSFEQVLRHTSKLPAGAMVFLLSDFYNLDPLDKPILYRLKKRADVLAIKIFDPLEKHLPHLGQLAMSYGDEQVVFDSSDRILHKRYEAEQKEHEQKISEIFKSVGIPQIEFSTAVDPAFGLKKIFSGRW